MFNTQDTSLFLWNASGLQASHSIAYPSHAFFDAFFLRVGEAQAEPLLATAVDMEWLANGEGNLLLSCFT